MYTKVWNGSMTFIRCRPVVWLITGTEAGLKWTPFCKTYFQVLFLLQKWHFEGYFTLFHRPSNNTPVLVCLSNGLVPTRRQSIILTNIGLVYVHIHVSLDCNRFRDVMISNSRWFHTSHKFTTNNRQTNRPLVCGYQVVNQSIAGVKYTRQSNLLK